MTIEEIRRLTPEEFKDKFNELMKNFREARDSLGLDEEAFAKFRLAKEFAVKLIQLSQGRGCEDRLFAHNDEFEAVYFLKLCGIV